MVQNDNTGNPAKKHSSILRRLYNCFHIISVSLLEKNPVRKFGCYFSLWHRHDAFGMTEVAFVYNVIIRDEDISIKGRNKRRRTLLAYHPFRPCLHTLGYNKWICLIEVRHLWKLCSCGGRLSKEVDSLEKIVLLNLARLAHQVFGEKCFWAVNDRLLIKVIMCRFQIVCDN